MFYMKRILILTFTILLVVTACSTSDGDIESGTENVPTTLASGPNEPTDSTTSTTVASETAAVVSDDSTIPSAHVLREGTVVTANVETTRTFWEDETERAGYHEEYIAYTITGTVKDGGFSSLEAEVAVATVLVDGEKDLEKSNSLTEIQDTANTESFPVPQDNLHYVPKGELVIGDEWGVGDAFMILDDYTDSTFTVTRQVGVLDAPRFATTTTTYERETGWVLVTETYIETNIYAEPIIVGEPARTTYTQIEYEYNVDNAHGDDVSVPRSPKPIPLGTQTESITLPEITATAEGFTYETQQTTDMISVDYINSQTHTKTHIELETVAEKQDGVFAIVEVQIVEASFLRNGISSESEADLLREFQDDTQENFPRAERYLFQPPTGDVVIGDIWLATVDTLSYEITLIDYTEASYVLKYVTAYGDVLTYGQSEELGYVTYERDTGWPTHVETRTDTFSNFHSSIIHEFLEFQYNIA